MAYWILKTEPTTYSFDNLAAEQTARWDGVTNPVAVRNIRSMQKGDPVMIYHTGDEKAVVGLAEVASAPGGDTRMAPQPRLSVVPGQVGKGWRLIHFVRRVRSPVLIGQAGRPSACRTPALA